MRMKLIAGNWKMYKTISQARALAQGLAQALPKSFRSGCVVICPVFTALRDVYEVIKDSPIKLGAQDLYWESEGAFTGEVSGPILKDAGCSFVIIGHSERRKYFAEANESVNKKIKAALSCGLTPIVCVGETLKERKSNKTLNVVEDHIKGALEGIDEQNARCIVIAYEPVWAIGTGVNATPKQAEEVHNYIRGLFREIYSNDVSDKLLILYGGSVKPSNIEDLMKEEDIDGALVGGASLEADSFIQIVNKSIKE